MELLILLLILLILVSGTKGSSGGSGSRLITFETGERDEDLIDKVCIRKGGVQVVMPNPPPDPVKSEKGVNRIEGDS